MADTDCKCGRRSTRASRSQGDHPPFFVSIASALAQADPASHPDNHSSLLTRLPEPALTSVDPFSGLLRSRSDPTILPTKHSPMLFHGPRLMSKPLNMVHRTPSDTAVGGRKISQGGVRVSLWAGPGSRMSWRDDLEANPAGCGLAVLLACATQASLSQIMRR